MIKQNIKKSNLLNNYIKNLIILDYKILQIGNNNVKNRKHSHKANTLWTFLWIWIICYKTI